MISLFFIFGYSLVALQGIHAYMLVQVRKTDASHSNVDALIHKVVSSEKIEQLAERMKKKKFSEQEEDTNEDESSSSGMQIKMNDDEKTVLDLLGPPSKMKSNSIQILEMKKRATKTEPDFTDIVKMAAKKIAKSKSVPVFRSKSGGYLFKPETVNLRSGQSSLYTLDTNSIVVALKDILSSTVLRAYLDKLTRKAAVAYSAVENELSQQPVLNLLG